MIISEISIKSNLHQEHYKIIQKIGQGSSAQVFLATYKPTDQRVSIKVIDLDMFERNQIDELRRELQIMTLSRHPNLLQVASLRLPATRYGTNSRCGQDLFCQIFV